MPTLSGWSSYPYYIWVCEGSPAELFRQVQVVKPAVVTFLIELVEHSKTV